MGRWTTQDEMVCIKGTVVCYAAQDEDEAAGIVRKHNADVDAYEAKIAELVEERSRFISQLARCGTELAHAKRNGDTQDKLARIAALVRPVPVADLVEAGTEAHALLAERRAKIRAILEDESNE